MRKITTVEDFKNWAETFPVGKPSVKINGSAYPTAVVAVDFGTPLEPLKVTDALDHEITSQLRAITSIITGRRNVRIQYDASSGVYWSSI